jgi:hypothetical protein
MHGRALMLTVIGGDALLREMMDGNAQEIVMSGGER